MTAHSFLRAGALGVAALVLALGAGPASAIVGGGPAPAEVAARTVLIVSTRGASCTGTALAPDLVLTAAHCVKPAADYAVAILGGGAPRLIPVTGIVVHPSFADDQFRTRRPTPDLAVIRLAENLPASTRPARLSTSGLPAKGTVFLVAGYGMTADGAEKTAGTLRAVSLPSIGTTGGIMARLSAPEGAAGACTGDSGGPAFADGTVAGVVSWVTAAGGARGCGGVTGITLVGLFSDWIRSAAAKLGRPLGE
ncbi:S1 family peptidase [Aquabacter sp. P-9]|uniref:S1 family peptidase n=1 Tax=Aquabacter sediminis TaxID=3029197 RepID=UPI00237DB261|nr:trypsin-like serine protease [Aquabacter sp. P-9]MDE1567594.1 trypsin-like serine protease [Aquabacter sp. P-9]